MAEHVGAGAGRSFYEVASSETQAEKFKEMTDALEEIKQSSPLPFSDDWWNDETIWGGPITYNSSGTPSVGEVSKASKVIALLNLAQIAFSSGLTPGLTVQQVGFDYQPLIIVEDQPTTALALWEDNLPVMSLNGAASVPVPLPVGQMSIAYNSNPNGVHYPVGTGAMPIESFIAYAINSLGFSINLEELGDDIASAFKQAIADYTFANQLNQIPIVFDENGYVYAPGEAFDSLDRFLKDNYNNVRIDGKYVNPELNSDGISVEPSGFSDFSYYSGGSIKYISTYSGTYWEKDYSFNNAMVVQCSDAAYIFYDSFSERSRDASTLSGLENATWRDQNIPTVQVTYNGKTYNANVLAWSDYPNNPRYSHISGDSILYATYNGTGTSLTSISNITKRLVYIMLYGVDEVELPDGLDIWTGNSVDYTQGGIEIITNPDITQPEVEPYYPLYVPNPVTNPGKTVSPEVQPNPHAPSEFPNIDPFIQPQIEPEVLPEKEREKTSTETLTLPFPTVLPTADTSTVTNPIQDPSGLDWPYPDTPYPPPPPPAPPKPTGITPDIGVPDATLWPTIIPDHSVAGQGTPGLIHVYNPTPQQFVEFGRWLWVTYADATIDKIWNNPFDGVISAHELYYTPTTGAVQNIRSGFLVSTASAAVVPIRYTNINCGTMIIPEYWANYLDYSPYSKAHVYLPFIGIVELDVDDIVGHAVNITYAVDAYNGSCIAQITVAKTDYQNTVYQFSGNCSVEVPLSGGSQAALKSAMLTAGAYGLTSVIGGIMGNVGAVMSGAYGALGSLLNPISQKSSVQHSGSFGASHGAMGIKKPFIIIRRPIQKIVNNYNLEYGFPAHKSVLVGNCSGYLRVREVNVISSTATNEEKSEIERLLKEGVYVT